MDCDLLVVGGGPVGLTASIAASSAGMRVTLLEPRPLPVDKACGEGLMPGAVETLRALGVEPVGRVFHGIRYLGPPRTRGRPAAEAIARFSRGPGLGVRRTVLSAALADRAARLGVTQLAMRADLPVVDAGGVSAGGVRARWLIAADGLHSPVRRGLGLDVAVPGPARYGLRRHYRLRPWSDLVDVHWAEDAEAYVTPVDDDLVGVAVLCGGGRPYDAWVRRFPALLERLDGATPASAVRGCGPLRQGATRRVMGRVLLVGDAAGYVDALTGEGIAVGMAEALAAVQCLVDGEPQRYEAQWRHVTRRYRVLTGGLLAVAGVPRLRPWIVPAAQALPGVFRRGVDGLG